MPFAKKFTPEAVACLRLLPPEVKRPLRALIDELAHNPHIGKPLQGDLDGFCSVRHQRYRVIYEIDERHRRIVIAYVGKRANVYDQFERLIAARKYNKH